MPPQNTSLPTPNSGHQGGQFDFILQPHQPAGASKPSWKRLAIFIGGGVVLAIILLAIALSLFSGGSDVKEELVAVAAEQQEIVRLSDEAIQKSRDGNVRSIAATVSSAVGSDQAQLKNYFKTVGIKADAKQLAAGKKTATVERLKSAEQNGRYDSEFLIVLQESLNAYQQNLKNTFNLSENQKTKALLKKAFDNGGTILTWEQLAKASANP